MEAGDIFTVFRSRFLFRHRSCAFNRFLWERNPFEHLITEPHGVTQGLLLFQMDLFLVMHEKTPIDTGVCV